MTLANIVALLLAVLMSGCAALRPLPSNAPSPSSPSREEVVAPAATVPSPPSAPRPPTAVQAGSVAVEPAGRSAASSTAASTTGPTSSKIVAPAAKLPAKSPAPPAPAAQPPARKGSAPDIAAPRAPPLDLASLEQRLKDTKAIGVLTKITLKNQVDDLLNQFRAFYQGTRKTDLAALRRSYDLLVLKVLSLLQDTDQALASAIAASREAIWGILSDPAKFATL